MNKSDLKLLERVFAKEIIGGYYQSKSKQIKKLEEAGYVQKIDLSRQTRLGLMKAEGYRLTLLGNITYCTSDLCREESEY